MQILLDFHLTGILEGLLDEMYTFKTIFLVVQLSVLLNFKSKVIYCSISFYLPVSHVFSEQPRRACTIFHRG